MATSEQLKALLKSHLDADDARFFTIVMQIAAQEARQGHGKLATELKEFVDAAKLKSHRASTIPLIQPRGELAGLLSVSYPERRLSDLILESSVSERLHQVVVEHLQQHKIRSFGLSPKRKLLLIGPPGTGKTLSASALAGEMNMPLCTVLLDGLISKYMGETSSKLRVVFEAFQKTRGVYLFDELDAIGGKRSNGNDVGEIRRVLNSFLQFLEEDHNESIMVAASNHADLLDFALFRRFDEVIQYNLPDASLIKEAMLRRLSLFEIVDFEWNDIIERAQGLSYGDLSKACDDAAINAILIDSKKIKAAEMLKALKKRRSLSESQ